MTYEITDQAVAWKGKRLKGVTPDGFEVLHEIIGRGAGQLYVLGKPFAADAGAFRLLNEGYATDGQVVFRILETKLKPMKADAAAFAVLGPDHGRDARQAYFKDKRISLAKGRDPADLRLLDGALSTDGVDLYHGTKRVSFAKASGVDWTTAEVEVFGQDDEVNVPEAKVRDATGVWLMLPPGRVAPLILLPEADFERLAPVEGEVPVRRTNYHSDGKKVWFRGALTEADAEDTEQINSVVMRSGSRFWVAGTLWDGRVEAGIDLRGVGYLIHAKDGLYIVKYTAEIEFLGMRDARAVPAVETAMSDMLERCLRDVLSLHRAHDRRTAELASLSVNMDPVLNASPHTPETELVPMPKLHVTVSGAEVTAQWEGREPVTERVSGWYRLIQRLLIGAEGLSGTYLPFQPLNGYPKGNEMQELLQRRHFARFLDAANAVFLVGEMEEAEALIHSVWSVAHQRMFDPAEHVPPLAAMPMGLVPTARYRPRTYGSINRTTNLGAGRFVIDDGRLQDADWRRRLDALYLLNGLIWATDKPAQLMADLLPALIALAETEEHVLVQDQIAAVLHTMIRKVPRSTRVGKGKGLKKPYMETLRFAISYGVDVEDNRQRLTEVERAAT